MAFDVSVAVIGILAAGDKVAQTLGPLVPASKQAPKHAIAILAEIYDTRIILNGIQNLFNDLIIAPQRRNESIPVDQLIAALIEGVLLFSELEALIDVINNVKLVLLKRVQWTRKDHELDQLVSRLWNFNSLMGLLLSILWCASQSDAQEKIQQLIDNTSSLIQSYLEVERRLADSDSSFDTSQNELTAEAASLASTLSNNSLTLDVLNTRLQRLSQELSITPHYIAEPQQFENILRDSSVYQDSKKQPVESKFSSSIALSHDWSALSSIILGTCQSSEPLLSRYSRLALPIHVTTVVTMPTL